MNKKKNLKLINFPSSGVETERQVEAILFSAEEPLDIETIKSRMTKKNNVEQILNSLEKQYKNRGFNLISIAGKWSFRTAKNLSSLMNLQKIHQSHPSLCFFVLMVLLWNIH